WTLGTEMSFYLVLPFYAMAMRGRSARVQLTVLALLGTAALLCRSYVEGGIHGGPGWALGLPGAFGWFAFGVALGVVSVMPGVERLRPLARYAWPAALVLFLVLAYALGLPHGYVFVTHYSYTQAFGAHLLSGLIGACVVFPALFWQEVPRVATW